MNLKNILVDYKKNSNLKMIVSNIAWMLYNRFFLIVFNLIVVVQIANYYGANEYGLYQYAVSVVALFEIIVTFVDARVVKKRFVFINDNDVVWNAELVRIFFSIICILCGTVFVFINEENKEFNIIFFILMLNMVILNLRFGMQNRYEYLLKTKKIIIVSNISLILIGILQLVALSFKFPIIFIALITLFGSVINLGLVCIQYYRDYGKITQGKFDTTIIKAFILESLPLAFAASCSIVYSRCGTIMLGNMLSKADVGIYAISLKLMGGISIMLVPIRESVYPRMIELYEKDKKLYESRYIQISSILTWLYFSGVGFSFLALPYLFNFLKPEYALAFPVYQICVLSVFFMFNAGLRTGHFTLINRGNILAYSQLASIISNIILNYILIKRFGLYGVAISIVLTQGISLFFSNLFFGEDGREVFIWQLKALNPKYCFRQY